MYENFLFCSFYWLASKTFTTRPVSERER